MDKVKLRINTLQTIDEAGNEDRIELITEAMLIKKENYFTVNYDESNITETEGSKTRLKIYNDKLIMSKIGALSSKMEFEEGKTFKTAYSTPYGSFNITINTIDFINSLDREGKGNIFINYKLSFRKKEEHLNKLRIEIV